MALGYSNTNHLVLGVLIEEVTGRSFAGVLRARVVEPLGMRSTYLAGFEDGPGIFGAYASLSEHEPAEPIDFDFTSIATLAWAAGGMVSTAPDLHTLLSAMFDGQVVSTNWLAEMIGSPRRTELIEHYGLGVQVWQMFAGRPVKLVGHGGEIVGCLTLVAHAPETGITAFWVVTNN